MDCNRCGSKMFRATLTGGLWPVLLTNKKKGFAEEEKRCAVLCYVCPQCGSVELFAEDPKKLQLN